MRPYIFLIAFSLVLLISPAVLHCQDDDDGEEIKMTQPEWRLKRDQYAVSAIKLLERIEKLDSLIDSLKTVNTESEKTINNSENDLYALVGATKEQVNYFRKTFEETERNINSKKGTPSDYADPMSEISNSKIRCLPEFSERFNAMMNKLSENYAENNDKEVKKEITETKDTYTVKKGDYLARISVLFYGTRKCWTAIWEANKEEIIKENYLTDPYDKIIFNPDFIYPGQVLKIPALTDDQIYLLKKAGKHKK